MGVYGYVYWRPISYNYTTSRYDSILHIHMENKNQLYNTDLSEQKKGMFFSDFKEESLQYSLVLKSKVVVPDRKNTWLDCSFTIAQIK